MSRLPLLPLLACLAVPALGQNLAADPYRPTAQERAWLQRCIEATNAEEPQAAFARCATLVARACLGAEERGLPALRQPPGRNSHPRSCAPIETALWDELLKRWYREAMGAMLPEAQEALRRAQRAWVAFRDTGCSVQAAIAPGFLGADIAADCTLARVATRALELRALVPLAREHRQD